MQKYMNINTDFNDNFMKYVRLFNTKSKKLLKLIIKVDNFLSPYFRYNLIK